MKTRGSTIGSSGRVRRDRGQRSAAVYEYCAFDASWKFLAEDSRECIIRTAL